MRTRKFWLLGGFCLLAAAAVLVGHQALAGQPLLDLDTPDESFPLGGEANLIVTVDPSVVGGYGELYAKVVGETEFVQSFPIDAPSFAMTAPIPDDPALLGKLLTYRYEAYDGQGDPVGLSSAARGGIVDPEPE